MSPRHLRRIFEQTFGVSPLAWQQTQRLLSAKALLTDTRIAMQEVAQASGFGSLRRFNAAFVQHYRIAPGQLRKASAEGLVSAHKQACIELALPFRPPFDAQSLFEFWKTRQINAIECIAFSAYSALEKPLKDTQKQPKNSSKSIFSTHNVLILSKSLDVEHLGQRCRGWLQAAPDFSANLLCVRLSDSLAPALPSVVARLRAAFDLDADPKAIDAVLGSDFPNTQGLRVPGALDGFEIAVRAIVGQQVTVAAGRTLAERLVEKYGEALQTPWSSINRCFPRPEVLALAQPEDLGALGVVRQRQQALIAVSQAVVQGKINLNDGSCPKQSIEALKNLPGIGDWTAQYIAMRALRWPDAFPAGDIAIHNALDSTFALRSITSPVQRAKRAEDISQRWKPWRSYAVLRIWGGFYAAMETKNNS